MTEEEEAVAELLGEEPEPPEAAPSSPKPPPVSPKRAAGATHHSKPHHSIAFDSQLAPEETEMRLCKLFGNAFPLTGDDDRGIYDRLSVRDLRVIIRVLDLRPADQINVRKPELVDCLQRHLLSDHMMAVYTQYLADKEERAKAREKTERKKVEKPVRIEPVERISAISRRKPDGTPKKVFLIPRLKNDKTFSMQPALDFLVECNRFVNDMSDRFTEMERAVSVLNARIDELEVFYGLND
jgi:hypothetical protein